LCLDSGENSPATFFERFDLRLIKRRAQSHHGATSAASRPGAPSTITNSGRQAAGVEIVEELPPQCRALASHIHDGKQDLLPIAAQLAPIGSTASTACWRSELRCDFLRRARFGRMRHHKACRMPAKIMAPKAIHRPPVPRRRINGMLADRHFRHPQ
jgi:hypothetical protein